MSILLGIQEKLSEANQRVAELEQALAQYPDVPSIAANLDSAIRVRSKLQAQFTEAAARWNPGLQEYQLGKIDEFQSNGGSIQPKQSS